MFLVSFETHFQRKRNKLAYKYAIIRRQIYISIKLCKEDLVNKNVFT